MGALVSGSMLFVAFPIDNGQKHDYLYTPKKGSFLGIEKFLTSLFRAGFPVPWQPPFHMPRRLSGNFGCDGS